MSPACITPESGPWSLHDVAASRAAEAAALATAAPHALMQRAGLGVARLALALAPHARRITVLAGPGNNGGDGLVAATHLNCAGKAVYVALLGDAARLPADAAAALQQAQQAGVPIGSAWEADPGDPTYPADLLIDALLGLGTRRAAEGAIADAIRWANASAAPILAIDLPSGLHADTGVQLGDLSIRAHATLALLTLKPGLFTGQGRDAAGAVWFDTLGVATAGASATLSGPPARIPRQQATHKGSYGDVAVIGGAPGMSGAAWLAASAALAAGAGRVYCSLLDPQAATLFPQRPELMARARSWTAAPPVLAATTVACGCGGGMAVREALPALLAHSGRLVLDADALNVIAADTVLQALLRQRTAQGHEAVLTPHPLEAARLLGVKAGEVQADRLQAARQLAERFGAVVVLKGSGSVIAAPGALPAINPTGNALLATAGTGDVLAGWLAGLWAQGGTAHAAAMAAVWQHGHAADKAAAAGQHRPLRAADLIEALHSA
jgi:hydroxyethylthiazole kinase-like uncharacterized protein yjeF